MESSPAGCSVFCPKCGQQNPENNFKCTQCGRLLPDGPRSGDKNDSAVLSCRLALFSLIPGLGIFLGIPAMILGGKGQRYARRHPEKAGIGHAFAGQILGLLGIIEAFLFFALSSM
jgi:hypothetical protein